MKRYQTFLWMLCVLFPLAGEGFCAPAPAAAGDVVQWQTLEPGLDLARVTVSFTLSEFSADQPDERPPDALKAMTAATTVLRIDPRRFAFSLYMASESGLKPLAEVCENEKFVAAVNAGMFQRDGLTSTGFLRSRTHTNNNHVAANFGAFFVAEPEGGASPGPALPPARLLDRQTDDWESALTRYGIILQNYRMATSSGRMLWKRSERFHSMAALSQDAEGRVLFLLCPAPVPVADYMAALLRLPLGLGVVMYLEGGSEAALFLNAGGVNTVEAGRHISGLWEGGAGLLLPNVLGVRRRGDVP